MSRNLFLATSRARLDHLLAAHDPNLSRNQWQKAISVGNVYVAGKIITRSSHLVEIGQEIAYELSPPSEKSVAAQAAVEFEVLYEDADLIVVNKPAGLIVHPGALDEEMTLVHGLLHRYPELAALSAGDDQKRPGIVHRLDKGTSGVMVIARTAVARLALIDQFQSRTVNKHYLAWAFGQVDAVALSGVWQGKIGRASWDRKRFAVVVGGKEAQTEFKVVGFAPQAIAYKLVLLTGRTHQIRVHAHHAGTPLLGDDIYKKRGRVPLRWQDWSPQRHRPALHAHLIEFFHPRKHQRISFSAPLPTELVKLNEQFSPL